MKCPHCGKRGGWISTRYHNQRHEDEDEECYNGYKGKCVREKWKCPDGHEWTQWTCEF